LVIEIGGNDPGIDHDVLFVNNAATLDGLLTIALTSGFEPAQGDQFGIISAGAITDRFSDYGLPVLNGTLVWRVVYDTSAIVLRVQRPADATNDGSVNTSDLLAVINGWGTCPPGCAGDMFPLPGGDGLINVQDLLIVINNWDS
jgi:hypothetical protein